jgi:hypothetical protein
MWPSLPLSACCPPDLMAWPIDRERRDHQFTWRACGKVYLCSACYHSPSQALLCWVVLLFVLGYLHSGLWVVWLHLNIHTPSTPHTHTHTHTHTHCFTSDDPHPFINVIGFVLVLLRTFENDNKYQLNAVSVGTPLFCHVPELVVKQN